MIISPSYYTDSSVVFILCMDEIVDEVKMSKGGVYHYFSGKATIFEVILEGKYVNGNDIFEYIPIIIVVFFLYVLNDFLMIKNLISRNN